MKIMFRNFKRSLYGIALLSAMAGHSLSAPSIQGVSGVEVGKIEQGMTIQLQGVGFGERPQGAAPVLFDFAEFAYEWGELNTHQAEFGDGDAILRPEAGDPSTLWEKSSWPNPPVLTLTSGPRALHSNAHYLLEGYNSFLGWPTAYGGSDTPVDNNKLYVAWYLKMAVDPRYYWAVSADNMRGTFQVGEKVVVGGSIDGQFLGQGTTSLGEGMYHFIFEGQVSSNNLVGREIKGQTSGASTIFPTNFAAGSGQGFEPPGSNKYIRIWEDPSGNEGLRVAWTQMQLYTDWYRAPVTPERWHLMELLLDADKKRLEAYVDRELLASIDISAVSVYEGKWSPTIALLGFNGKLQEFQRTEIDDIYMDRQFGRVVIGAQSKFSDLKSYELQLPTKWSDNSLEFQLNLGAIDPVQPFYAYVINEAGEVNEYGYPLCAKCPALPNAPTSIIVQ